MSTDLCRVVNIEGMRRVLGSLRSFASIVGDDAYSTVEY